MSSCTPERSATTTRAPIACSVCVKRPPPCADLEHALPPGDDPPQPGLVDVEADLLDRLGREPVEFAVGELVEIFLDEPRVAARAAHRSIGMRTPRSFAASIAFA
jgi:hypothetical protein